MASVMRGAGFDPTGGSSLVPPGNPNAPLAPNTTSTPAPAIPGGGTPAPGGTAPAPNLFGPNPFGTDASALLQFLGAGGPSFGSGASPLGSAPPPADARPPEERFQVQLQVRTFVVHYT